MLNNLLLPDICPDDDLGGSGLLAGLVDDDAPLVSSIALYYIILHYIILCYIIV